MIKIKRIYESAAPSPGDGKRILTDRLWPSGLRKGDVAVDEWTERAVALKEFLSS